MPSSVKIYCNLFCTPHFDRGNLKIWLIWSGWNICLACLCPNPGWKICGDHRLFASMRKLCYLHPTSNIQKLGCNCFKYFFKPKTVELSIGLFSIEPLKYFEMIHLLQNEFNFSTVFQTCLSKRTLSTPYMFITLYFIYYI